MGVDEKTSVSNEATEAGDSQSKKAAKKQAKEAAKAAKVIDPNHLQISESFVFLSVENNFL